MKKGQYANQSAISKLKKHKHNRLKILINYYQLCQGLPML